MLLVPLVLGLLVLGLHTKAARAAVPGNVYTFTQTQNELTYRDTTGPSSSYTTTGQFQVTTFNVTASDRYEYNYYGYHMSQSYPVDRNDSVDFQDNKVYFDLNVIDPDDDNRSDVTWLEILPYTPSNPGRDLFVNPVWSTHDTDWNDAVDDAEDENVTTSLTHQHGEGQFSVTIVVDTESVVSVGGIFQDVNGTMTFEFAASYDTDGVLSSWSFYQRHLLQNENYSSDYRLTITTARGSGGPVAGPADTSLQTTLAVIGVTFVVALVIGLFVGKRRWG